MKIIAIAAIKGYQKWLSPHKGFRCAHAALNGGTSCSSAVIEILESFPYREWNSEIRQRFHDCKSASLVLNTDANQKRRDPNNEEIGCCFYATWGLCWPE